MRTGENLTPVGGVRLLSRLVPFDRFDRFDHSDMAPRPPSPQVADALGPIARAARRALVVAARGGGAAAQWLGREALRRRLALLAVATRVVWWVALFAWVQTAVVLLGPPGTGGDRGSDLAALATAHGDAFAAARVSFVIGAIACALIVLLASSRRMRWAGGALGSMHGASAVVLWLLAAV